MSSLEDSCVATPASLAPGETPQARSAAAFVTQLVAMAMDITPQDIAARSRKNNRAARARHLAIYLTYAGYGWPLAKVALAFSRDRSTVTLACEKIETLRDQDPKLDAVLEACEAAIRAAPRQGALT